RALSYRAVLGAPPRRCRGHADAHEPAPRGARDMAHAPGRRDAGPHGPRTIFLKRVTASLPRPKYVSREDRAAAPTSRMPIEGPNAHAIHFIVRPRSLGVAAACAASSNESA